MKYKKAMTLLLAVVMLFGVSNPVMAAGEADVNDVEVINLFDPNDPNLIEIVDVEETARTTSRPTEYWGLNTQGAYTYSAYSNNNIMWTRYIFFDSGNFGWYKITANSTNTHWRLVIHNCENGRDYYYSITSTSVVCLYNNEKYPDWGNPDAIYFGVDTTLSRKAVSVEGYVTLG